MPRRTVSKLDLAKYRGYNRAGLAARDGEALFNRELKEQVR